MKIIKYLLVFILGVVVSKVIFEKMGVYNFQILKKQELHFADSSNYKGTIEDGIAKGVGELTWRNGDYYKGEFLNGLFHGDGEIYYISGDSYKGQFENGYAHGFGEYTFANGDRYKGGMQYGYLQGTGEVKYKNGGTYNGTFDKGLFDGKGTIELEDGTRYIGEFKGGFYDGNGSLRYSNGDVFVGNFKRGLFEGFGSYHLATGDKYIGNFAAGHLTGEGELSTSYGLSYKGDFKNWLYHGEGYLKDITQEYNGEFNEGVFHGKGKLIKENETYKGEFAQGYYQGNGEIDYKSGSSYVGSFNGGLANGSGKYLTEEGIEFETEWLNGKAYIDKKIIRVGVKQKEDHDEILLNNGLILRSKIEKIKKGTDGKKEFYHLLVAGDGSQKVFEKEVNFIGNYLNKNYTLVLANQKEYKGSYPMATKLALKKAIKGIASKMNLNEDVFVLYLTSHGSKKGALSIKRPPFNLSSIYHDDIAEILQELNIKNKIIIVSSCYSGTYIPVLKDDFTSIITASSATNTSFGCSNESEITWFAKAFFEGLTDNNIDLEKQFKVAVAKVKRWEERNDYEHSDPQIWIGRSAPTTLPIIHKN